MNITGNMVDIVSIDEWILIKDVSLIKCK